MALFRKYRKDKPEEEITSFMNNGMKSLQNGGYMKDIIDKMFSFDLEVVDIEREIFYKKNLMAIVFNYSFSSLHNTNRKF